MNCPYCGAELIHHDSFGTLDYINGRNRDGKRGDIYTCPNRHGFKDKLDCDYYLKQVEETYGGCGYDESEFEHIVCENGMGNGYYHTYVNRDEIREGYPC